jgi:hypothetical protein
MCNMYALAILPPSPLSLLPVDMTANMWVDRRSLLPFPRLGRGRGWSFGGWGMGGGGSSSETMTPVSCDVTSGD